MLAGFKLICEILVTGAGKLWEKGLEVQGSRFKVQRFKGSEIERFKGSGLRGSWLKGSGFKVEGLEGSKVKWFNGLESLEFSAGEAG